jgi:hypothetical protein
MSRRLAILVAAVSLLPADWTRAAESPPSQTLDTTQIEQLTGAKGQLDEAAGVFKVSMPRADLDVHAAGARMTPPLGLTSWAAFTRVGEHVAMMGDMVLLEDQVNPVMSAALDAGLDVTALHNHFLLDSPTVMFMHIGGMNSQEDLAKAVGKVFAAIQDTSGGKGAFPKTDVDPAHSTIDPKRIEPVLGVTGTLKDGVYKVVVGRSTKMSGHVMSSSMGVNTWAAFAGSDASAIVDGDVAMLQTEVQPVLRALRSRGIQIVEIHNHMTEEEPRIIFLHYWGVGASTDLAAAVRAALNLTRSSTP